MSRPRRSPTTVASTACRAPAPKSVLVIGAAVRATSRCSASLDAALSLINPLRDAAGQAAEAWMGSVKQPTTVSRDAEHDRADAVSLRTKSSAAKAALAQDAQEILLEVNQLRHRIKAADGTLKRLAIEHEALTRKLSRAETVLEQAEAKRQDAEAERESAVTRWWGCVDTGLPRLRGVLEPPARHVTAALETARAARSAISIRDWPEDQNLTAQRVQNRWAAMVESASGLRSKLEQLGGRSVRVIPPGDGREDFPGGVELMIDGTGAALAPPAAGGAALLPADPVAGRLRRGTHQDDQRVARQYVHRAPARPAGRGRGTSR